MSKNIFDFSNSKMSSGKILETKYFNIFSDSYPITKIHGLITPKQWQLSFGKLSKELNKELSDLYTVVSKKINNSVGGKTGFNIEKQEVL